MCCLIFFTLVIICGILEWKRICAGLLSFVYICIAVGDLINMSGDMGSHKPETYCDFPKPESGSH